MIRGYECRYIVLDRGSTQLFNRLQLFCNDGEFVCRLSMLSSTHKLNGLNCSSFSVPTPYYIEQINVLAINKENDQLIIIDSKNNVIALSVETVPQIRVINTFNITGYVHEASDVAVYKGMYYITDYKTHAVVMYTLDGSLHKYNHVFQQPIFIFRKIYVQIRK